VQTYLNSVQTYLNSVQTYLNSVQTYFNSVQTYFNSVQAYFNNVQTYLNNFQTYLNSVQTYLNRVQTYLNRAQTYLNRVQTYLNRVQTYLNRVQPYLNRVPAVQLAYNTSQNSTTRKSPSLVEKGWNPLLPVDHLKKNLLTIHPKAKDFHDIWKKACDTASKCIAEAKEYNKQRWHKSHMEPEFKEGDQVLEFSRKPPVFPMSLVKPYFQKEEDKLPSRKKNTTPPEIVEVEDSPGPVKKIINTRKIRLNGKDQRQHLVRFKHQTADKDKWLAEDAIP
ncbi:hypothetical protein O181_085899, partial [Austropuccinia psidii MF-1]|nr:hypothetical protein [Austropuccinia psidii MF-1]